MKTSQSLELTTQEYEDIQHALHMTIEHYRSIELTENGKQHLERLKVLQEQFWNFYIQSKNGEQLKMTSKESPS